MEACYSVGFNGKWAEEAIKLREKLIPRIRAFLSKIIYKNDMSRHAV